MEKNTIYASDLSFKLTKSQNGDLSVVTNKDAIKQSIHSIILTRKGSRVMNPHFGCSIDSFLFENMTEDMAQKIGTVIRSNLVVWEPRIEITSTSVNIIESDVPGYEISIDYLIKSTLTSDTYSDFIPKRF